jgi:RNA polymerase sigma factor (TIGR02999 family)
MDAQHQVTQLLGQINNGNRDAIDELMPLVYAELRRIAARHLSRERSSHTLQPTALVHEAFIRMVDQQDNQWQNRLHFMNVAATVMRRVLIDHARAKMRDKRGGANQQRVVLDDVQIGVDEQVLEVLSIDSALEKLAQLDPEQARVIELRFFGGVSVEEVAAIMNLSTATVKRYTSSARAWLAREIGKGRPG